MSELMIASCCGGRLTVRVGDLTKQAVDAIVNAANPSLMGGGGVDGAIHRAGGPAILEACRRIRETDYPDGLPAGEAVITPGGDLPARFVIHTVGPVFGRHGGSEPDILARCYERCLTLACAQGLSTIAFPAISTGAYGYPFDEAARVVARTLEAFLATDERLSEIRLVFPDEARADRFVELSGLDPM